MNVTNYQFINEIVPEEDILFDEPMSRHTTFRVGGPAKCFLRLRNKEQLIKLIPILQLTGREYFLLGNGSNLLVGDKGYDGIVVKLEGEADHIIIEGERMRVPAGVLLSKAASVARDHGLSGMEFASGIPGTIGGAVVMNAGAYDGDMSQVIELVEVMNVDGDILELDHDTMEFGYRTSVIRNRPFIVLETVLKLTGDSREAITARMEELTRRRKEKQPLEFPSAGSTFKRPEGYFAGKLIMDAGLRGYSIGGARISEKHCGFVVNENHATAADVREVIEEAQQRVKNLFGVNLEPEVIYLGSF